MDIEIVATGSSGNFNVIDDVIAIDCGVKRDIVKPYMPKLEHVLISHQHGDHISLPVLRMFKREKPGLLSNVHVNKSTREMVFKHDADIAERLCGWLLAHSHRVLKTSKGDYHVRTFRLYHDVENQGFVITSPNGERLVHATDTCTMQSAPEEMYDYILVEGNWDESKLLESLAGDDAEAFRASRNLRHLSVQSFMKYVDSHSHSDTVVYQLHESAAYGVRADMLTDVIAKAAVNKER